ncbi:MAG: WD40 repeat domain-containing protein [Planctomycetota bacterium]|nr:WD40 repeat domain-containing protein [Planctomycetota bacterium]
MPGHDHFKKPAVRQVDAASGAPLGALLRHEGSVLSAGFSPDGARVVTASEDQTARVWDVPVAVERDEIAQISSNVIAWARAVAGLRFKENGELEIIPDHERRKVLEQSNLPPGPWAKLAAWLQTTGPERKLSPKSKVTLRQVAERERDFLPSSRASLGSALKYDPSVPLARMMLANVLEKEELAKEEDQRDAAVFARMLARAAHWRRYDLDRLPDDAKLWARAAEILRQLPEAQVGVGPKPITAAAAADQADHRAEELTAK